MSRESIPATLRRDKYIQLEPVLKQFYPQFQFGKARDPIDSATQALESVGIHLNSDTLGGYREDSKRNGRYCMPQIGELLLLNALYRDEQWTTPSPAATMALVTETGQALNAYGRHHVRQSGGLTPAIAEIVCKDKPEIIPRIIRGIRIDGAIIAEEIPAAWERLQEVTQLYAQEYEALPLGLQKNSDMIMEMENAHTPRQLYAALYKLNENIAAGRRVGTFVPYELDYWKWLIEQGIIASYKHLPFTRAVLDECAHGFFTTNIQISNAVTARTGIPVDNNAIQPRMHMIRTDLPEGFT